MASDTIVTPPIRMALVDPASNNGATPVRDWWLYWNQLARVLNQAVSDLATLADIVIHSVTVGTHADRLASDPDQYPVGALWFESDRDRIVYQVQEFNGGHVWSWTAGTMWGTLSPDQRPTDLGAFDAGFLFEATDTLQQFRWSGTVWVLATTPPTPQSPWTSDIDGATFRLINTGNIGVGNNGTPPAAASPRLYLTVGSQTAAANGIISACVNQTAPGNAVGIFAFANYAIGGAEKRVAQISALLGGTTQTADMLFNTWNAGAGGERMRITAPGNVGIGQPGPAYPLDVGGDVNCAGGYRKSGVPGLTVTITIAKLTTGGVNGSLTFQGGILTGSVQPT